jgi:MraZ protein
MESIRFIGNIEAKVDAKGRIFLPAVFRKVLQQTGSERLVVRQDVYQQCLVVYPETVWNQRLDELSQTLDRWNKQHQLLLRQYYRDAEETMLDSGGRFMLTRHHLAAAEIRQDVRFIGMGDTIEIWACEKSEEPFMQPDDFAAAMERAMKGEKVE